MSTGKGFAPVSPSDTQDLPMNAAGSFPVALRFGVGGTAVLIGLDGSSATFVNVQNGETIPCSCKRVMSTGSSGVSSIVAIY